MFNFFDELKQSIQLPASELASYQIINIAGKLVYIEGHLGITQLSKETITFKVKTGRISIQGEDLVLSELTSNTIKICGKIHGIEALE